MKQKAAIIILMFVAVGLSSQSDPRILDNWNARIIYTMLKHDVPEISCDSALRGVGHYIFLDARAKKEYDISHIANAVWIGYDEFDFTHLRGIDKKDHLIVYCSIGYRSEKISKKLILAGYNYTTNLYGGIFEWVNREYPVVNNKGEKTNAIHGYDRVWGTMIKKGDVRY